MITAPVFILCSRNITFSYFAQRLARILGLSEHAITPKLEEIIAEKLSKYPRPLFIDQANYLNERALGTICYIWESANVPIILAGTKSLFETFVTSQLTEDVRAQLSSRISLYYQLPELSVSEAKAIIQRALSEDATDELVEHIYKVTGGIHRHIDMLIPRILDLKDINKAGLEKKEVTMKDIVDKAGSCLIIG